VRRRAFDLEAIKRRLTDLETESSALEPGAVKRAELRNQVVQYSEDFLEALPSAPGYVASDDNGAGITDLSIPAQGRPLDELLNVLAEHVDRPGINPASGAHLGYIPGGGLYPSALGDYLACVTNRYSGVFYGSPGAARMEHMLIQWLAELIGFPDTAGGDLTSGGSIANLTALVTAREAKGIMSVDVPKAVIYTTEQVHHCVGKALIISGLREAIVRRIPMDERYRMWPEALAQQIKQDRGAGLKPFLVIASAGTTDTGAVDPLDQIADVTEAEDLWFHVDGAYGGFFVMCPEAPQALRALSRADSVVLDPHKSLFLPYGSGALIVRDREKLYRAHRADANYMQDTLVVQDEYSPADHSPELTRPFRGLRMWLPLQLIGTEPFRAALSEKIWLARYFYLRVQEISHIVVGPEPDLSVVMFRSTPPDRDSNEFNTALVQAIQKDGRVFLSSTTLDGVVWIRLAVLVFRSHRKVVDLTLEIVAEHMERLIEG